jgi:nucleoside-diphosphate-sugar epimerase
MRIAITGASGLVGSYAVRSLSRAGHAVRALVRPTSERGPIADFVKEWVVGDQADPQVQAALVAGVDAVVHNAVDWEALSRSPVAHYEKNVLGALRLLEASRQAGVAQFLFISSGAVYNEILPDRALDENHPTWPGDIYGAYKAAVEPYLKAYHKTYGMNTSSWRPVSIYGVDPNFKRSQWFDLIDTARRGGTVDTPRGGKITNVQDIADALTYAIGDASVAGQFYNLVDGYMYSQVAAEFAKELSGSSATIIDRKGHGPRNQYDTRKAIDFFNRHGNSTAIRRGHDGVREYVKELLEKMKEE